MITRRGALRASAGAALAGFCGVGSQAAELNAPATKPILTVSGRITRTNIGDQALFDMPMLEALGEASIRTATPWFTGPVTFTGVLMTTLMECVGANGTTLVVSALNDYVSELPLTDFATYQPILALRRDGNYMPVRDKGPLFIIYPYDSSPELNQQRFYSRSPWQIARMRVA